MLKTNKAGGSDAPNFKGKRLVQYSGTGSGVLANGTVLDLHGRSDYQSPADIIGNIEKPGIWKVQD